MDACGRDRIDPPALTYAEALDVLAGALKFGIHPSLDTVRALVGALGEPDRRFLSVQVAGTNGKTSTARLLAAILRAEGLRVALYTSPHLVTYRERMEIDGRPVSEHDFARAIAAAQWAAARAGLADDTAVTEFEMLTAAALWLFAEHGVDVAVLEVGLGGRWDATSVVSPAVAVVTGIGLDHTDRLGDTLEAIAAEKAAIIKPATAPVLGPGTVDVEHVFLERAEACATHARAVRPVGSPTPVAEDLTTRFAVREAASGLRGHTRFDVSGAHGTYADLSITAPGYQAGNVATAIAAAEAALGRSLRLAAIETALRDVTFPGRFELVATGPDVVVDGSHNPQAALVLARAVAEAWPEPEARPVLLLGMLGDKDAAGVVEALAPVVREIVVTALDSPRARPAEDLARVVAEVTGREPRTFADVGGALEVLRTEPAPVLVAGSLVLAGEARALLLGE